MQNYPGIAAHLAQVRAECERLTPEQAMDRVRYGSHLIDTRPDFQRREEGEVPFAIVIERNHLEWRLDPTSSACIPEAVNHDVGWIILCDEGYSSESCRGAELGGVFGATRQQRFGPGPRRNTHCYRTAGGPEHPAGHRHD